MLLINKLILLLAISHVFEITLVNALATIIGLLIAEYLFPFLVPWVVLFILSLFLPFPYVMPFSIGGVFHVLTELPTLEGIQPFPYSRLRVNAIKGVHRKGEIGEYIVTIILASFLLLLSPHAQNEGQKAFVPFMYNWEKLYDDGVIDGKEWKDNRMNVF
jgi:inner membrane protein